jgi:hypothetical protein
MCIQKDCADAKAELQSEIMQELHQSERRCIQCNTTYVKGQTYENYNDQGDWKCKGCLRPEIDEWCRWMTAKAMEQ